MTLSAVSAALREGNLGEARRRISAMPAADPAVAHLDAIISWREGRIAYARRRFDDALRTSPAAQWLANAADFEAAAGDTTVAATLLRRAIAADPVAAPPLRLRLSLMLIANDRLIEAAAELEGLVRDVPHSPAAWQALGAARRKADDTAGAAAAFDQVLHLRPADPLGLLSRAQLAADLGRRSVPAYRRAMSAGASPSARLGLAAALAGDGCFAEAIAILRTGLSGDPAWEAGWSALASIEHQTGGREASRAAVRAMFDELPNQGALQLAAIRLLMRTGDHATALTWIGEARLSGADSPPLQLVEAEALSAIGEHVAAGLILDRLAGLGEPTVDLAHVRHALHQSRPEMRPRSPRVWCGASGTLLPGPISARRGECWVILAGNGWKATSGLSALTRSA